MLSEADLYERWRNRWSDFLDDVDEAAGDDRVADALRDKVIIGNAERKIAGGHEGREVLELLQNARDAIREGDRDNGRVYVGVYDEGVLVANTGSRFDFFDPQVENAVTMIGETGKGDDDDDQSIGHKGVGLKSILATGDSFEIFTRPDEDSDDILGVRLSRSYLIAGLLTRLGYDVDIESLTSDIKDPQLATLLQEQPSTEPTALSAGLQEDLSKLPLFNFPAPLDLSVSQTARDSIADRATSLLRSGGENEYGHKVEEPFRTAVFVRYRDDAWHDLLDAWDIPEPEEDQGDVETRPERIWSYLSQAADADAGLQPETLVQLGHIDELHLERSHAETDGVDTAEHWEIERESSTSVTHEDLTHNDVCVSITEREESSPLAVREFDQFAFDDGGDYGTRLLVNKRLDEQEQGSGSIQSYPLYLFYPIQNTSHSPYPFCLHGRFRVETNRKDLSRNNTDHNQAVLEEAIDLIAAVGVETATAHQHDSNTYSDLYPWILLPAQPDGDVTEPSTPTELLQWFNAALFDRLREIDCIPTASTTPLPADETLLHWNPEVLSGYNAYHIIQEQREQSLPANPDEADARPVPARNVLTTYEQFPESWSPRIQALLGPDDTLETSRSIAGEWAQTLATTLAVDDTEGPAIATEATPARNLLIGTVTLLVDGTDGDDDLRGFLKEHGDVFDGVLLLPCKIRGDSETDRVFLTQLERRRTEGGRKRRSSRSVIWDIESAAQSVDYPPTPPEKSSFTVYFLDEAVQEASHVNRVLSRAGRAWGLRAYEGIPSFYRSLLDAFVDGGQDTIQPVDFGFLVLLINRLGSDSDDLQANEGSFFPLSYLQTAIEQGEGGDQRQNLRRRVDLRSNALALPGDQSARSLTDTVLDDDWQRYRAQATTADSDTDPSDDWTALAPEAYPGDVWSPPEGVRDRIQQSLNNQKRVLSPQDVARTLSLLGAATLPGMEVVWMYGDQHPRTQRSPHWNPAEWDTDSFTAGVPDKISRLQRTLSSYDGDYQTLVTAPGYHPTDTANHSPKCDVNTDRILSGVTLSSWAWITDTERLKANGDAVRELLRRHGDSYTETLLQTGWCCSHDHKRRTWTQRVPSLLNWQLRSLQIWEPILNVHDDVATQWDAETSRLRYAVVKKSTRGAQAARLFPHVTDEAIDNFSGDLLDTLGVKPLSELNATEAADQLQALQETLTADTLSEDSPEPLSIPPDRTNDWQQAYTQLLQPLLQQLSDDDGPNALSEWPFLTHFPLREGNTWVAAPLDWIDRHAADRIRHYEAQSPKPWETQEIEDNDYLVLHQPAEGPFSHLADALAVQKVDASKLVLERDSIEFVGGDYAAQLERFRNELLDRRDLLVASTERTDEAEIKQTADELTAAARDLDVAESFPDRALRQLSDDRSALYRTADGHDALLFNEAALDGELTLDALAMGLALLVERPTKVATFREALQSDIGIRDLENRWAQLTFPIETVKELLGTRETREFEARIDAVSALLDAVTDTPIEQRTEALNAIAEVEPAVLDAVEQWLAHGATPSSDHHPGDAVETLVTTIRSRLPEDLGFVLTLLFDPTPTSTSWPDELQAAALDPSTETTVIQWLADHRRSLHSHPFDPDIPARYGRLLTVRQAVEHTDTGELTDLEAWRSRIQAFSTSNQEDIPWTTEVPDSLAEHVECPPLLFYLTVSPRLATLIDSELATIETVLPDDADGWQPAIKRYITDGTFPDPTTDSGAKEHQHQAFSDITSSLGEGESFSFSTKSERQSGPPTAERASPTLTVSSGSTGSGGGTSQFRGRGQQAEAYVMAGILERTADWLADSPGGVFRHFRDGFRKLYENQQGTGFKWHVDTAWENRLLPILDDHSRFSEQQIIAWQDRLQDGEQLRDFPFIQLINITMERGPGFDVIDPFGPVTHDVQTDGFGLAFTPVEVKAVNGNEPPFRFRLTTNEYRRCKAFIREADVPYVVRLVDVPEPDTPNWPQQTAVVTEKILDSVEDVETMITEQGFENVVKGGYMNMEID
jgi:hypothetical protein